MSNTLQALEVGIGSQAAAKIVAGDDGQLKARFMAAGIAVLHGSMRDIQSRRDEWLSSTVMSIGQVAMDEGDDLTVERLRKTMARLRTLNAMLEGVPVDLERLSVDDDCLPILDWFKELQATTLSQNDITLAMTYAARRGKDE